MKNQLVKELLLKQKQEVKKADEKINVLQKQMQDVKKEKLSLESSQEKERKALANKLVKELNKDLKVLGLEPVSFMPNINEDVNFKKVSKDYELLVAENNRLLKEFTNLSNKFAQLSKENTQLVTKNKSLDDQVKSLSKQIDSLQKTVNINKNIDKEVKDLFINVKESKAKDQNFDLKADGSLLEDNNNGDSKSAAVDTNIGGDFLNKLDIQFKNKEASLFESRNHYVMAKSNINELIVIPKTFNTKLDVEKDFEYYNSILVKDYGYNSKRQSVSPVSVLQRTDKYIAFACRTESFESLFQCSHKDTLAGYVSCSYGKTYLWVWDKSKYEMPYITDLGQKVKNKNAAVYSKDRKSIFDIIQVLCKEYEEKLSAYCEERGVANTTAEIEQQRVERRKEREKHLRNLMGDEIFQAPTPSKEQSDCSQPNSFSSEAPVFDSEMDDFVSQMFG